MTTSTRPRSRPRSIATGVIAGLMLVSFTVSFAAFIHSDAPSGALTVLIALFLVGAGLANLVAARWSSLRGVVMLPQGPPAAVTAAALMAILPGVDGEDRTGTALVFVGLATGLAAVLLVVLGWRRVDLTRVPRPVTGGLIAGSGLVLVVGGARLASGGYAWSVATSLSFATAVAFALVVVTVARRRPGAPVFPILVLVTFGLFHLVVSIVGMDLASARAAGLLLPATAGALELPLGDIGRADLGAILGGAGGLVLVPVITALAYAINVGAVESLRHDPVDMARESWVTGLANGVSAITTSSAGYPSLGLMALVLRSRAAGRTLTVTVAAVAIAAAVAAVPLVATVPVPLVGGLLMAIGLSLAADWFADAARTMSPPKVGMMVVLAVVVALGWFWVALGLAVVGGVALRSIAGPDPVTPA